MNVVTHIFKKDLRRSRLLLTAWLFLLALEFLLIGIAGTSFEPQSEPAKNTYEMLQGLTPTLRWLALIVIVPLLIQEEPLVGTTAFWFTRPISRGSLLKSKTLFVLVILTLPPLVAELIVLAANGTTIHDLLLAAPEIMLLQLLVILCAAVLAVLTPDFGRFAIVVVVGVLGVFLLAVLINSIMVWVAALNPKPGFGPPEPASLMHSTGVAARLLAVAAAAVMIVHQYLTRKTARTIGGLVVAAMVVLLAAFEWHWDFFKPKPLPESAPGFDSGAITVSFTGDVTSNDDSSTRSPSGPCINIQGQIHIQGIPKGYLVADQRIDSYQVQEDGTAVDSVPASVERFDNDAMTTEGLEAALGGARILNAETGDDPDTWYMSLFVLTPDNYQRLLGKALKTSVKVDFEASKFVVMGELALAKGARYDHGSEHTMVTDVLRGPGTLNVIFRERNVNLMFHPPVAEYSDKVTYVLLNKKRAEAVTSNPGSIFFSGGEPDSGRLVNRKEQLWFGKQKDDSQSVALSPAWLADATLERLEQKPVAEFSKEIKTDNFRLH